MSKQLLKNCEQSVQDWYSLLDKSTKTRLGSFKKDGTTTQWRDLCKKLSKIGYIITSDIHKIVVEVYPEVFKMGNYHIERLDYDPVAENAARDKRIKEEQAAIYDKNYNNSLISMQEKMWNKYSEINKIDAISLDIYLWNLNLEGENVGSAVREFFDFIEETEDEECLLNR